MLKTGTVNKLSKVFGLLRDSNIKGTYASKSQKQLSDLGLANFKDGVCTLMPFTVKSLRKLEQIVRREMKEVEALEIVLPTLTDPALLEKSGRLDVPELFILTGREKKKFVLNPTCEEAVTHLTTLYHNLSLKNFPLRFYQINSKFRDERRTRCGLLKAKEFLMKDLYCFDKNDDTCEECYHKIINQYYNFFDILKIPCILVEGPTGSIGGLKSHEFHFLSDSGEDKLIFCNSCGEKENWKSMERGEEIKCPRCQSNNVETKRAIEVGHAFKLGTRFTEPLGAQYSDADGKRHLIHMSCYGLGLTRILGASLDVLSKEESLRWPISLAPYLVSIIPPKKGSKEEKAAEDITNHIYQSLNQRLEDDVLIDDLNSSIGKRLLWNQKVGIPFQVVIGKRICDATPVVEVHDCYSGSQDFMVPSDVSQFILDKLTDMFKIQPQRQVASVQSQ